MHMIKRRTIKSTNIKIHRSYRTQRMSEDIALYEYVRRYNAVWIKGSTIDTLQHIDFASEIQEQTGLFLSV
jgi:hypothetical protein